MLQSTRTAEISSIIARPPAAAGRRGAGSRNNPRSDQGRIAWWPSLFNFDNSIAAGLFQACFVDLAKGFRGEPGLVWEAPTRYIPLSVYPFGRAHRAGGASFFEAK
jgi:hypothetical protein